MTKTLADDLRKDLNKAAKETIAYDLHGDNPTDVKTWISTGQPFLIILFLIDETGASLLVNSPRLLASLPVVRV